MPRRENAQNRKGQPRPQRPGHVLVVCGGQRTEPDYFAGLRISRQARLKVRVKADSPENLVKYAKSVFSKDEYDAAWCVVDVDHFDIDAATRLAAQSGIELAVSNPCFEVWLLLHHVDHKAFVKDGKAACALLGKHVPGYDKKLDFAVFEAGVEAAVERAKALDEPGNPSTGVWRLVENLLSR
nr:RloB family protein [Lentzea sp. NBRC 105346]